MRLISVLMIALVLFACEKDKFTTKPQLKFKSVNTTEISGTNLLQMKFDLTDKEGDFTDFLGYKKTVRGCPTSDVIDSVTLKIPEDFIKTKGTQGDLVILLDKRLRGSNSCFTPIPGGGTTVRPDTSVYSFWVRDKAGNVSDTARSVEIIVLP